MLTKKPILRIALCGAVLLAFANLAWSDDREDEVKRVKASADVLDEILAAPDKGIPQDLMESDLCLGVVPSLLCLALNTARASPPAARQPGGALRRLSKWSAVAGAYKSVEK